MSTPPSRACACLKVKWFVNSLLAKRSKLGFFGVCAGLSWAKQERKWPHFRQQFGEGKRRTNVGWGRRLPHASCCSQGQDGQRLGPSRRKRDCTFTAERHYHSRVVLARLVNDHEAQGTGGHGRPSVSPRCTSRGRVRSLGLTPRCGDRMEPGCFAN